MTCATDVRPFYDAADMENGAKGGSVRTVSGHTRHSPIIEIPNDEYLAVDVRLVKRTVELLSANSPRAMNWNRDFDIARRRFFNAVDGRDHDRTISGQHWSEGKNGGMKSLTYGSSVT